MHTKFELNRTDGSWDTKQREIWTLTFICIAKIVISTWCYYVIWLPDHITYAYKIWAQSEQWLLRYNTKGDLNFDLHLHSQDGLISTLCYYVIWLADHIAYAYKIWTQSEQWLLTRYNTIKERLNFDLHLHSQDGLISTWCYNVIWLADHTAYAYKVWARVDQWLLKYNTKRGLTLTFICIVKMASYQLGVNM